MGWNDKWKIVNQEGDTWCQNGRVHYWSPKHLVEENRICKTDWLLTTFLRLGMGMEGIETKAIFLQEIEK